MADEELFSVKNSFALGLYQQTTTGAAAAGSTATPPHTKRAHHTRMPPSHASPHPLPRMAHYLVLAASPPLPQRP